MSNWIVVDAVGRQYLSYGRFNSKEECLLVCGRLNTNHPEFDFRPVLDVHESKEKLY
ncbi:hypothetical protein [Shouchella clausii]|uniref:hypothetical protein n=1 Tax=Shouchella clausii TaxID=79880 RepID=UPI001C739477|nr:hypothetical protein [Shouchella clausii]MBX0320279.1 hypothetical protein [Shouchella clausii]MEB5480956.1 hypothetical protein [Shouchella clausii]